jgi:PAS domain S-box-containing protein
MQSQQPDLQALYEKLQESEEKYRRFVENAADVIYRTNGEGRFIYVNPVSLKMFGYAEDEFLGKHYLELFHPAFRNKARQFYATQFFNGQYSSYLEFPAVTKEGKQFWLGQNVQPLMENGQIMGFQAVARDITERVIAEEAMKRSQEEVRTLNTELELRVAERTMQLENANKELEAFSYSVSHDLRAPLLAINGFTQFLVTHLGDKLDEEGKRLLSIIRTNTQTMQHLISALLMLSKTNKKELDPIIIDMTALAQETYNEIASPEAKQKILITIPLLPDVRGDKMLLRQVWSNLLSNAIKFTLAKDECTIAVGGRTEENKIVYFVKDSGAGFDMKDAGKLFGVFSRLHSDEEFEGTGIGLSIVRRVIHRHKGDVWAEGEVGKGATFYFSLPKE